MASSARMGPRNRASGPLVPLWSRIRRLSRQRRLSRAFKALRAGRGGVRCPFPRHTCACPPLSAPALLRLKANKGALNRFQAQEGSRRREPRRRGRGAGNLAGARRREFQLFGRSGPGARPSLRRGWVASASRGKVRSRQAAARRPGRQGVLRVLPRSTQRQGQG